MNSSPFIVEPATGVARFVNRLRRPYVLLSALLLLISAGILVYSQTMAFVWDEGFHLVTARLIEQGKTPYIDFCFPQTLVNAYFNAAVLRAFGDNWHVPHVFDALFVIGAVVLTADFIYRRFPVPRWRFACAVLVACFVGLDCIVVQFGTIAQAYGSGLFFSTAAFRCALSAFESKSLWPAFLCGLMGAAAAGGTLLAAPLIPVLFLWIFFANRAGNRWAKTIAFALAAVIPFAPEIALLIRAPQQTWFNVVRYQALFRRVNWGDANTHDVDVLSDWLINAQALLLGLLAVGGFFFIRKRSNWTREQRAPFYLAAWLSLALGVYIATAHPTFGRYFIFMIPFVAVLAAVGFYAAGSLLFSPDRPAWPLGILCLIVALTLGRALFDERDSISWYDYEDIARKIKAVTPPGGNFLADEVIYFILQRNPPPGFEFSYSHKLTLPRNQEALYHVVSEAEVRQMIQAGFFYTVESCKDDFEQDMRLEQLFPHKKDVTDDCTVYWGKVKPLPPANKPSDSKS